MCCRIFFFIYDSFYYIETVKTLDFHQNVTLSLWSRRNLHQTAVPRVSSIPASDINICLPYCFVIIVFTILFHKHNLSRKFANRFAMFIHWVFLTYCNIPMSIIMNTKTLGMFFVNCEKGTLFTLERMVFVTVGEWSFYLFGDALYDI